MMTDMQESQQKYKNRLPFKNGMKYTKCIEHP